MPLLFKMQKVLLIFSLTLMLTVMPNKKSTDKNDLCVLKVSWKLFIPKLCSNLLVKFAIFLKIAFLTVSIVFSVINKSFRLNNLKLEQLWMLKFQCLFFVLKQSYICYYVICMTVPLRWGYFIFQNFREMRKGT